MIKPFSPPLTTRQSENEDAKGRWIAHNTWAASCDIKNDLLTAGGQIVCEKRCCFGKQCFQPLRSRHNNNNKKKNILLVSCAAKTPRIQDETIKESILNLVFFPNSSFRLWHLFFVFFITRLQQLHYHRCYFFSPHNISKRKTKRPLY